MSYLAIGAAHEYLVLIYNDTMVMIASVSSLYYCYYAAVI